MSHHDETALSGPDRRGLVGYEAPRVERVLTPAELSARSSSRGTVIHRPWMEGKAGRQTRRRLAW